MSECDTKTTIKNTISYGFVAYALSGNSIAAIHRRHSVSPHKRSPDRESWPPDAWRVRVLLVRTRSGRWDFPKGTYEPIVHGDSSPLSTARREFKEETGFDPEEVIIGVDTDTKFLSGYEYSNRGGSKVKKTVCLYLCRLTDSILQCNSGYTMADAKSKIDYGEVNGHEFVWLDELESRFTYPEDSILARDVVRGLVDRLSASDSTMEQL